MWFCQLCDTPCPCGTLRANEECECRQLDELSLGLLRALCGEHGAKSTTNLSRNLCFKFIHDHDDPRILLKSGKRLIAAHKTAMRSVKKTIQKKKLNKPPCTADDG